MPVTLFRGLFLLVLSFTIFSCSQQDKMEIEKAASAFDIKQGEAAVKQSNQHFIKSYQASDSEEIAQSFTKNAQLLCANHAPIEGRQQIGHYFLEMIRQGSINVKLNTINIWGDSTILVEEGKYLLMNKNGGQADEGSYVALWQQESGNWKIYRDIWVSSIPKSVIKIDSAHIKY